MYLLLRSPSCNNLAEKVYQAACDCKYEKILDLVQHVDELRNRGNVTLPDLLKAVGTGDNPQKYLKAIDDCYVKNSQKTPSIIRIVTAMSKAASVNHTDSAPKHGQKETESDKDSETSPGNDSGKYIGERDPNLSHAKPVVVDMSIVNIIRDFFASQAFNKDECVPCTK